MKRSPGVVIKGGGHWNWLDELLGVMRETYRAKLQPSFVCVCDVGVSGKVMDNVECLSTNWVHYIKLEASHRVLCTILITCNRSELSISGRVVYFAIYPHYPTVLLLYRGNKMMFICTCLSIYIIQCIYLFGYIYLARQKVQPSFLIFPRPVAYIHIVIIEGASSKCPKCATLCMHRCR